MTFAVDDRNLFRAHKSPMMNYQELSELLSVLGISDDIQNVTTRDINVAFRKQAPKVHPDKASEEEKEEKTEAFKKLRAAYDQLKKYLLEKPADELVIVENSDEDVFFADNFDQFNFPFENKGSFTVSIEDYLADTWQEFITKLLGEPKVVINPWGTECDRIWKINYTGIDITMHMYNKPKNKNGSKLMLQGSHQSILCSYVFEELPNIYKLVCANKPRRLESRSGPPRKSNSKPVVKCDQCNFKSTLVQMKMHLKTIHATKPKRAHERLPNFTPLTKPAKRSKPANTIINCEGIVDDDSILLIDDSFTGREKPIDINIETNSPQEENIVEMKPLLSCGKCEFDCETEENLKAHVSDILHLASAQTVNFLQMKG